MGATDERPHLSVILSAVSDDNSVRGRGQAREKQARQFAVEKQPRSSAADLALPGENGKHGIFERHVGVGIGKNDVRIFPAKLQGYLLQIFRPRLIMILRPVAVPPVKAILSTRLLAASDDPTGSPAPSTS